jgi:hypothetical protein
MFALELLKLPEQTVIRGVGEARAIENVIQVVVVAYAVPQRLDPARVIGSVATTPRPRPRRPPQTRPGHGMSFRQLVRRTRMKRAQS